jgi:hypothetical protein
VIYQCGIACSRFSTNSLYCRTGIVGPPVTLKGKGFSFVSGP